MNQAASQTSSSVRAVLLVSAAFVVAWVAFFPGATTNGDEWGYAAQAQLWLEGRTHFSPADQLTGVVQQVLPAQYPAGTAALLMPSLWLFGDVLGPRAIYLSLLAELLLTVAVLAVWLRDCGRSPTFALLWLGFLPVAVLSRTVMSGIPSALFVTAAWWMFFRGREAKAVWWLASGFVAGCSLLLREPNALLLAVLFAGAVVRRERKAWLLVVGGLMGSALRPLAAWLVFDDPLYTKDPMYGFDPGEILGNLPLHATALLVMVPGGLLAAALYRGDRCQELATTVAIYVGMHLCYGYSATESGWLKQVILVPRFYVPLVPILCFAVAHELPRWWGWAVRNRPRIAAATGKLVAAWLILLTLGLTAVQWRMHRWSRGHVQAAAFFAEHVRGDGPLATQIDAVRKYLDVRRQAAGQVDMAWLTADHLPLLRARHEELDVVLVQRTDSDHHRRSLAHNRDLLVSMQLAQRPPDAKLRVSDELTLSYWRERLRADQR